MLKKLKIIPTAGLKNVEKINRNRRCLCKMLQSMLFWCRLFGLAPIKWSHPNGNVFIKEDGRCHFEISKPWTWYSIGMILIYIALLCVTIDLNYITTSNANVLYILHECIYYVFSSLLTIFGVWNAKRLAQALNDMQPFLRSGLMCQSSKLTLQKHNFIAICIILIQLFLQYVALIYMIYNGKYITNVVQLKELISKIIQNVPFMFYYLFCTICAMYVTLLMCFETSLYQTLSNGLLRPSDADSLGIMRFTRCTGSHTSAVKRRFKDDTFVEDLNALRILHENIRQTIIQANEAFNPQIAIHISIELGVIIMHLYAFITYINDNIKSGELLTFHFLDMFFVCCHTIGFIIFLSSGHGLKWTVILYIN